MRNLTDSIKTGWTSEKVFERYAEASVIKQQWDTLYKEVFRYFMPSRDIYDKEPNDIKQGQQLYTSLGQEVAGEFVNKIMEIVFPPQSDLMDLEAGDYFSKEEKKGNKDSLNQELAKLNRMANQLKRTNSNFDISATEALYDLFAGTCCLMITKGDHRKPITCRGIPISEFCINEGADGEVSEFYRKFKRTSRQIRAMWKDCKAFNDPPEKENQKLDLLEVSYFCEDKWYYELYLSADRSKLVSRESKTSPFQVMRWNKASGEIYGRGAGCIALDDMVTFNQFVKASFEASAFEAPMFEVSDDGLFNVSDVVLEAGALIGMPSTDTGDPRIKQIQVNTRMDNSRIDMERLEIAIRRTCFADTLPDSAMGNAKTATEIMEIARSLRKNFVAVFGRLINWQYNIVRRFYEVMIDSLELMDSEFKPILDVNRIDGIFYAVSLNTPLTKQLAFNEVQAMVQTVSMLVQLDPSGQILAKTIKLNKLINNFADKMGISHEFLYTVEEMDRNEQAMAQAQQAQVAKGMIMDVEANNAKEMGKAKAQSIV